jgi:hypothetical protein
MRITGSHDGNLPATGTFFMVARHLQCVGIHFMGLITTDQLKGIERLALNQHIGQRARHIQSPLVQPIGMAEYSQTTPLSDFVKTPHAGSQGIGVYAFCQSGNTRGQVSHLCPVAILRKERIDAETAPKIHHMHPIFGRVDLFPRKNAQVGGHFFECTDGFKRRAILAMISDRYKIHADLTAARSHISRRFDAVRMVGMHVGIPFIGTAHEQIISQGIQPDFQQCFRLTLLICLFNDKAVFLLIEKMARHTHFTVLGLVGSHSRVSP